MFKVGDRVMLAGHRVTGTVVHVDAFPTIYPVYNTETEQIDLREDTHISVRRDDGHGGAGVNGTWLTTLSSVSWIVPATPTGEVPNFFD